MISGATGMVGRALTPFLLTGGHEVRRLTRQAERPGDVEWGYEAGRIEAVKLEGVDAVVHLAGENIAAPVDRGPEEAHPGEPGHRHPLPLRDARPAPPSAAGARRPPRPWASTATAATRS